MISQEIDDDSNGIPLLAEPLFNFYAFDALEFQIVNSKKVIDFLGELYPNETQQNYTKMRQILEIEYITKFCHYAENLGCISIAFNSVFEDFTEEIHDIFKNFLDYRVDQIIEFFSHVDSMSLSHIAKILGYPPPGIQSPEIKIAFELSCKNASEMFKNVGDLYLELRQFYNSYKHGYRILLAMGNELNLDTFPYFYREGHKVAQKYIEIDQKTMDRVTSATYDCRRLLEQVFSNHRFRAAKESKEIQRVQVDMNLFLKKDQRISLGKNPVFRFKTRGKSDRATQKLAEKVYSIFKNELEKNHYGKYLALDLDKECVIGIESNFQELARKVEVYSKEEGGRLNYRRIGGLKFDIDLY